MKIGLILDKLDYEPSGIGDYEYNLTKQLLAMNKENEYILIHIKSKNSQNHYHDIFTRGKEVVVNQIKSPSIIFDRIINKRIIMPRILKKEEFDLIHEMSPIISMSYILSFKFITVHDIFYLSEKNILDKSNKFNLQLVFRLLNMYFLQRLLKNHPIHIITISEYIKQELINYLKISESRITVIYEGVNHEKYKRLSKNDEIMKKYSIPEDRRMILCVGSEHPRKNFPTLIKAFHKLKKKYGDVKLVKVGSPQWKGARGELLKLIKELNLQNVIIFTGYVSEEDLPGIYNVADLFVFPSFYEGFGLPPLEAMACGCPVITSNTSSIPEVVGDAGIMVDPYDVDGLADAMYEVLTNESLREDMIKRGLKRAKMFSWEKCARETLKVYLSLMECE